MTPAKTKEEASNFLGLPVELNQDHPDIPTESKKIFENREMFITDSWIDEKHGHLLSVRTKFSAEDYSPLKAEELTVMKKKLN
jgi:hypothetical protein